MGKSVDVPHKHFSGGVKREIAEERGRAEKEKKKKKKKRGQEMLDFPSNTRHSTSFIGSASRTKTFWCTKISTRSCADFVNCIDF